MFRNSEDPQRPKVVVKRWYFAMFPTCKLSRNLPRSFFQTHQASPLQNSGNSLCFGAPEALVGSSGILKNLQKFLKILRGQKWWENVGILLCSQHANLSVTFQEVSFKIIRNHLSKTVEIHCVLEPRRPLWDLQKF